MKRICLSLSVVLLLTGCGSEQEDAGARAPKVPEKPHAHSDSAVPERDLPPAEPRITKQLLKDAFSVLALTIAQDYSLDVIQQKYPDLSEQVHESRAAFDRAYREGIDALDAYMGNDSAAGFQWDQKRGTLTQAMKQMDTSAFTRKQALDYIETVKRRAKGDIPQRIYAVLAAFHPEYLKHPDLELVRGYAREYKSDGSGKALGLKLAFQYPLSWRESEGRRPHIVRKFATHDSFASAMLLVKKVPQDEVRRPVREALEYLSTKEYLTQEMTGAEFLSNGFTTIASQPASFVDYVRFLSRTIAGTKVVIKTRGRTYFIIYDGRLIAASFDVSTWGGSTPEDIGIEFRRREKLFQLMAYSVDFYDRYD